MTEETETINTSHDINCLDRHQELVCKIKMPIADWKRYDKQATVVKSRNRTRRKMRIEFHYFLAGEAQNKGVKCWLTHKFNYLQTRPAWRGVYNCCYRKCSATYMAVANEADRSDYVEIYLYRSGKPSHTVRIERRNRGKLRKKPIKEEKKEKKEPNEESNESDDDESISSDDDDQNEQTPNSETTNDETLPESDNLPQTAQNNASLNSDLNVVKNSQNSLQNCRKSLNDCQDKVRKEWSWSSSSSSSSNVDPITWDCDELSKFVSFVAGEDVSGLLKWHEIDGLALDYLTIDYMVDNLKLKIGPAAKIKSKFNELKKIFAAKEQN